MTGHVSIVGAGPGDPALLTRKAVARLRAADVVFYDALVDVRVLKFARRAQKFFVGKRARRHAVTQDGIHTVMIRAARRGRRVVRLKGGDPFVFGRGGEEALVLRDAGVPFEVVPGVSSALAGPAAAAIPVTHRGLASAVTVVTGHECGPGGQVDWAAHGRSGATLVVLMGMSHLAHIAGRLLAAGRPADEPVAVVQNATRPDQRTVLATLGTVADAVQAAGLGSPAVIVVGPVAALHEQLSHSPTSFR